MQMLGNRPHPGPKGVYIYGSVGTGKTMLLDLFYQHVDEGKKLRTHFNSFMLDVHASKFVHGKRCDFHTIMLDICGIVAQYSSFV